MKQIIQIISLILFVILFGKPLISQNFIGELNSINLKNDGRAITFKIKNITADQFNTLYLKAKSNKLYSVSDFKGYSEDDKIATIYLTVLNNKTLVYLQDFCLFLNIETVIFDNKTIASNKLNNQVIQTIESNHNLKREQLE